MIVTKLQGGLGNQMFQYAAGLRLALLHGVKLALDASAMDAHTDETLRGYDLAPYPIAAEVLDSPTAPRPGAAPQSRAAHLLGRLRRKKASEPAARPSPAVERAFHFDPAVLDLPDTACLEGYWQSERYFADVADRVRGDLTLRDAPTGRNAEVAAQIASCTAISLHVRRGDYVSNSTHNATHGVCALDYYRRAVEHVGKYVDEPVFFLFSDDPAWVAAHLEIDAPTVLVDHNGPDTACEDLRLMSSCAHHVLANSSFSWWGAWLNPAPKPLVVAPKHWFLDPSLDTRDLIPKRWVTL
jgi:hypothetical protein